MSLRHKPIGTTIKPADLLSLVANAEAESRVIEYKLILPGKIDSDKKEFLADVSSFANAAGGDIVYGMEARKGVPIQLIGLQLDNVDAEKLTLEEVIRNGIAPRIVGYSIEVVPVDGTKVAIVIRIPNSFARPHMVTFKNSSRFYSRNSGGKYQLDVSELRSAFSVSVTFAERARQFRIDRLARLVAQEGPVKLKRPPIAMLHLVPATAFDAGSTVDISPLLGQSDRLCPMKSHNYHSPRYNFDGLLASDVSHRAAVSYVQLFRNGIIEATLSDLNDDDELERKLLATNWLEEGLIEALPIYIGAQRDVGVQAPIFLMITLSGVLGYVLSVKASLRHRFNQVPIDRDQLNVPELLLEDLTKDSAEVLRPVFDAIWNAAAWPRCLNYDQNGNWTGR